MTDKKQLVCEMASRIAAVVVGNGDVLPDLTRDEIIESVTEFSVDLACCICLRVDEA